MAEHLRRLFLRKAHHGDRVQLDAPLTIRAWRHNPALGGRLYRLSGWRADQHRPTSMQCVSTGTLDIGREPARSAAALRHRGEYRSAPTGTLSRIKEPLRQTAFRVEHDTATSPPVQVNLHLLGLG